MANQSIGLDEQLYRYLLDNSLHESTSLRALRERTSDLPGYAMQISPEQGQFMRLLVKLNRVERALEVGVFTGYSALCVASALPKNGRLIACDIDPEVTQIAQNAWMDAGVSDRIDLKLGDAVHTLQSLINQGEKDCYDFAFIDADKTQYDRYYELTLYLLKPGGLMLIDNALWSGAVADLSVCDEDTQAIRLLNQKIYQDDRVMASLVPIGDGLNIVLKSAN
jgi:predicted O-methyltransferase YrrM